MNILAVIITGPCIFPEISAMINSHSGLQVHPNTTAADGACMPAWKTFDDQTAAALKKRLDQGGVSVETLSQPLFEHRDSVVIAPTLQKGAALVITARRKTPVSAACVLDPTVTANPVAEPAQPGPAGEANPVPERAQPEQEPILPLSVESLSPIEDQAQPLENVSGPVPGELPAEFIFGPTTWERAETSDPVPPEYHVEHETSSADPGLWDIPSEAPPQSRANTGPEIPWHDATQSEPPVIDTTPTWDDDRHVATGFLGLDDYVEDEEEFARAKRPWWKKIFSD